jgi:hypothetical protein
MLDILVLRGVLLAFSTMFGSLGMFFLYLTCLQPAFVGCAVLFLGVGSAIVWSMPQS